VPLRELALRFGLSRADSLPNLTRRIAVRLQTHPELADEVDRSMTLVPPRTKN
jgi:hypothetical protein